MNCFWIHQHNSGLELLPFYDHFQLTHMFNPVTQQAIFVVCYHEYRILDAEFIMEFCSSEAVLLFR